MCAIAGILSSSPVNPNALHQMIQLQRHRGPDGSGVWLSTDGKVGLGHQRLSIIDLSSNAKQPFLSTDRKHILVFNGEIYNYLELRKELQTLGYQFLSQSDSEVLLVAYMHWGHKCLDKFNGMFAFAIWDETKKELFCARDRFGEKPFYYSSWQGGFAFSSEVKALLVLKEVNDSIDTDVLFSNISETENRTDALEKTFFQGINQILPSHAMTVSLKENGSCSQKIWNYWQINRTNRKPYGSQKMEEASEEFFELLKSSVTLRLRSDVAVGSSLSGGLDSSSVVSLIRHLEPDQKLDTFTGRFPGTPNDEGYYASILQKAKNTVHHEVFPTPEKFIQKAKNFYWHAEFPVGGMSQFAQWCVFKEASNHKIKVLLDGQGSDEQLGGYGGEIQLAYLRQLFHEHRYLSWIVEHRFAAKANPARFSFFKVLTNDTPLSLLRKNVKSLMGRSQLDLVNFTTTAFQESKPKRLTLSALSEKERLDNLSNCLWDLSFRTMLSSLLRFGDRLSMAHGVEVRLPFCDHRISEFVFSLSPDLLVGKSIVKQILRESMKSLLPTEIQRREKQGFVPPQNDWLKNSLLSWLRDLNAADKGPCSLYFDRTKSQTFLDTSAEKDPSLLWRLLNYRSWSHFFVFEMSKLTKLSASLSTSEIKRQAV